MKKILFTCVICLATVVAMAGNWEGPCGVYLLVNGESQNYRLSAENWNDNNITTALNNRSELKDVHLGTIKTLVLTGGQMTAGANGNDYYETNSFRVKYRVYKDGETAPETWQELSLDELTYRTGDDYRYETTDKTIDLRALTDGRGGVWKFEAKMYCIKYWNDGNNSGSWDDPDHASQTASFYLPEHYYVAGNGNDDANGIWCGGTDHKWWQDYSGNEIVSGSKTFANVAAGNYEFKVTNGYWNEGSTTCNEYVYSDIDLAQSHINLHEGDQGTIKFSTDATSDITVQFNAVTGKISVTSTLGRFVRTPYSVVGDPVLGLPVKEDQWDVTSTATEMTRQDDGTYRFTISNIALEAHDGRKFKIVGGHSWSVYQAPAEGDFTVDIPVAGIYDLVFDFDPATNLATCTPNLHTQDVTISQYQFSTFYSDKAYTMPEGLTALIFTGIENEMLVMEEINPVPANTGVVLYGAANQTYEMLETQTDVTYNDNMLHGTLTDETINNANVHYILSLSDQGECGFFWPYNTDHGVGSFINHAGKAYLEIPGGSSAPARIRGFILTAPRVATAIEDVNEDESENACYDLLGRKVSQPQQGGVYIMNGKKMIIF